MNNITTEANLESLLEDQQKNRNLVTGCMPIKTVLQTVVNSLKRGHTFCAFNEFELSRKTKKQLYQLGCKIDRQNKQYIVRFPEASNELV